MLSTIKEWLAIYEAIVTTGLLAATIAVLRMIVKAKDATIEGLKGKIGWLETQTVKAVHEMNDALRKELGEYQKLSEKERNSLTKEKAELLRAIEELKGKSNLQTEAVEGRVREHFDRLISLPPSTEAAKTLAKSWGGLRQRLRGRASKRYPFVANVEIAVLQSETYIKGQTVNLNEDGVACLVKGENFTQEMLVKLRILSEGSIFEASGEVVHTEAQYVGIAFLQVDEESLAILGKWLARAASSETHKAQIVSRASR